MKPRTFIVLSLGLNLALAAGVIALWQRPLARAGRSSVADRLPQAAGRTGGDSPAAAAAPAAGYSPFHWRMIESDDYRRYIANLQAVGCPERTIRDIIVADIDDLYAAKMAPAPSCQPAWFNADHRRSLECGQAAKAAALKAEKRALVKELIGYEWDNHANENWHENIGTSLLLGFLSEPKPLQVMALLEKYSDLTDDVKYAANSVLIDEDRVQLRKLYDGFTAEMAQLLTPAEWEELQCRFQADGFLSANNIRWDGFAITGPELREFVRRSIPIQNDFKDTVCGNPEPSGAELALRKTAFEKEAAKLFGPARFAEYQRAQDPDFRETWDFTSERNAPAAAAIKIYAARRVAEEQAGEIGRDKSLTAEQRAAALAALKATAAAAISSALGSAYQDYVEGPGHWLETLATAPQANAQGAGQ